MFTAPFPLPSVRLARLLPPVGFPPLGCWAAARAYPLQWASLRTSVPAPLRIRAVRSSADGDQLLQTGL